jgi:xylulokinase
MALLGIDAGTSGCKAALYELDGRCLATAGETYPTIHPRPGWAELDVAVVLEGVERAVRTVFEAAPVAVSAVSFSSLGEAVVPLSAKGEVLANSILSSDARGAHYVERIASLGTEKVFSINPNPLGINYTLPKLCWFRDHEPELYRRTWKFLFWGDVLVYLLTGQAVTTPSLANRSLLFDINSETWSDELLEAAELDREKLPDIVPAGTCVGVSGGALGVPAGVRVVTGGHDQALNAVGAGAHRGGSAVCGIGTVECIAPVFDGMPDLEVMRSLSLNVEHHVLSGRYLTFLYNQAGSLLRWFRRAFAFEIDGTDAEVVPRLLAQMPDRSPGIVTTPYFEPSGSPFFRTDLRGTITGLTMATSRGDILRSILEGETFYFAETLSRLRELGLETSRFVATGGGARSDEWLQIKADVLDAEFIRPAFVEAGTLGAALLAALGTGEIDDVVDGYSPFAAVSQRFTPRRERRGEYEKLLERYRSVVERSPRFTAEENDDDNA